MMRHIAELLAAVFLLVSQGDANVAKRSVYPDYEFGGQGATSLDSAQESPNKFVDRLLETVRAERERAIQAAIKPLLSKHRQEQSDGVPSEMAQRHSALADLANNMTALRQELDFLGKEMNSINSSFQQQFDPFRTQVQSQLKTMDKRLQLIESLLDSEHRPESYSEHPHDCSDLPEGSPSGVYLLQPGHGVPDQPASAYCDMDTQGGGWTVFQRRDEGPPQQDFFLDWAAYKEGFGDLTGEFWWGLEKLWKITSDPHRRYELRIDLYDFDGVHLHAAYSNFGVSFEEDGYRLLGGGFIGGEAGDSLKDHFGHRFSTKDRDQDVGTSHCARTRQGGWWYHACHDANLNGPYLAGRTPKDVYGVNWPTWRGWRYSLRKVEMKIRPRAETF